MTIDDLLRNIDFCRGGNSVARLMKNLSWCRPPGMKASRYHPVSKQFIPATKQCRHKLCPYCHSRRVYALAKMFLSPQYPNGEYTANLYRVAVGPDPAIIRKACQSLRTRVLHRLHRTVKCPAIITVRPVVSGIQGRYAAVDIRSMVPGSMPLNLDRLLGIKQHTGHSTVGSKTLAAMKLLPYNVMRFPMDAFTSQHHLDFDQIVSLWRFTHDLVVSNGLQETDEPEQLPASLEDYTDEEIMELSQVMQSLSC